LFFYCAFTNTITKITPLNFKKTFILCEKDYFTSETKVKEKMI